MGTIAIIHTTSATLKPLNDMIGQACPGAEIINFVDDSILPMLLKDSSCMPFVYEKLLAYALFAQKQGVDLILSACSSVGEFQKFAAGKLQVPLVRIDDPVSDIAVTQGRKIAVLATLKTTLEPSCNLLKEKSPDCQVIPVLVEGAYEMLKAGNKDRHDSMIAQTVKQYMDECDVVYLAQASMANALQGLSDGEKERVLASTEPAVRHVAAMYEAIQKAKSAG